MRRLVRGRAMGLLQRARIVSSVDAFGNGYRIDKISLVKLAHLPNCSPMATTSIPPDQMGKGNSLAKKSYLFDECKLSVLSNV